MNFIYEGVSKYSLSDTLIKVKSTLKENGFGTLFELNFKDKFAEHALAFENNFYVLEVCNPGQAKKILDISLDIGYFLPCKVVIYEKDKKVIVGMPRPTALLQMIVEDERANTVAKEVETVIISSLEKAIS